MENNNKYLSYKEWREKLIENIIYLTNKEYVSSLLKDYEMDLPKFYSEGWTIEGLTAGMMNRFI